MTMPTYPPQNLQPNTGGAPPAPSLEMMNQSAQANQLRGPSRPPPARPPGAPALGPSRPPPSRRPPGGRPPMQGGGQRINSRPSRTPPPPPAAGGGARPAYVQPQPGLGGIGQMAANRAAGYAPPPPPGMGSLNSQSQGRWQPGPMNSRIWAPN